MRRSFQRRLPEKLFDTHNGKPEFNFNMNNLAKFQVRALLDYMNVQHVSSSKVGELIDMLTPAMIANPTRAQQAWDAVMLKKIGSAPVTAGVSQDDVLALIDKAVLGKLPTAASIDPKALMAAISKEMEKYRKVEVVVNNKPKKIKGVLPEEYDAVLKLASQRRNTLLIGPAGCGKTYIAAKVAEALDMEFSSVSCTEGLSESHLTGWLLPVGAAGKFEYVSAPFVDRYENGGVFLLDEVDASDANMLTILNQALANDGFYIPQRYKKPFVKKHADFVCIAAANTFGSGADAMYVGRNQLDAATIDRFCAGRVLMDYSPVVEEALIDGEVLKWGRKVREAIRQHRLRRIMSTRVMLDITQMKTAYKWTQKDWERPYYIGWSRDELKLIGAAS